jgi:hypothetical protein
MIYDMREGHLSNGVSGVLQEGGQMIICLHTCIFRSMIGGFICMDTGTLETGVCKRSWWSLSLYIIYF